MKRRFAAIIVAAAFAASAGAEPFPVAASLLPQAGVVERVGGDRVAVTLLVDRGQEPHGFRPSAKKVTDLAKAAIWFTSGMPFEEGLVEAVNNRAGGPRMVSLGVRALGAEGLEAHCEGTMAEGEKHAGHEHGREGNWDPHVWTAPLLVGKQALLVGKALAALDPEHAAEYAARAEAFDAEARELDAAFRTKLAPLKGRAFYVFHPGFGYFAQAYGLEQVAIETGGREPSAKHLTGLVERAKRDGAKLVLVQPQHPVRGAERIAEAIGAQVVEIDALAKDVFGILRTLVDLLVERGWR